MAEVVVALDVESPQKALDLVGSLPELRWVKVGPVLLLRSGADLIRELKDLGLKVFLDLKWHDIPNTVAKAAAAAADLGVDLATVHGMGGAAMISAAAREAGSMRLAAVTVLTSFDELAYWEIMGLGGVGRTLYGEVERLATMSVKAGAGALVSSTAEVSLVRGVVGPDPWVVVPGIRMGPAEGDDQRRTGLPGDAVRAGASHLVVGRPILGAENPVAVYQELCEAATSGT